MVFAFTVRQRAFLDIYLSDPARNATRAAESAGYAWPGKQGPRLTTMVRLAEEIAAANARELREFEAMYG